ncbi:MAG: GPW/gp25 family protein [Polyangiaceae bacterium]|nr:GPW/gp25 family protein [Polyangiaceae bacterium]
MADRFLHHPFRFGAQGGVAVIDDPDRHLRDKIEAVLFTSPGERVNRPDFGVGIDRAVFDAMNELAIAALEFRVTQALRRDIGDELILDSVNVRAEQAEGTLFVDITFRRRTDRKPRTITVAL